MNQLPEPGTIVRAGGRRLEVARHGCATYDRTCPYGRDALTVYSIKHNGERLWGGLTSCVDARKVVPE